MALFDFATVQVYEAKDYIEVVFPYDEDFVSSKDMKGVGTQHESVGQ